MKYFFAQKYFAFSFVTAMVMVAIEVSPLVSLLSLVLLTWKWGVEKLQWPQLSRRWTGILSVLFLAQILLQYRTLIGQEPAFTFLLGLSALRVMDYESERDHKFLVLLGFVLISVKALFSVDVYWVAPSALAFWGFWYSLLPENLQMRRQVLNRIFLMSLPLAVVLFVVFPRFILPWAISRGSTYGQIGFSDEVNPGRVAEIAASNELAFRAKIDLLPLKEVKDLYWRGAVLNVSRGLAWRSLRSAETLPLAASQEGTFYEVALEPTSQNFLFTLEGTTQVNVENARVQEWAGGVFRSNRPLQTTTMYRGQWIANRPYTKSPVARDLETPELKGQVALWVQKTLAEQKKISAKMNSLQKLFSENGFQYSINPGVYGANDLEDFLFKRRKGFCEHFAGAYGTLARALGIPARVVAGYQGGRYNPVGEFWKVSQRDAHAWVEVFVDNHWQRIDPTLWVAPLRLMIGGDEFFSLSEDDQVAFARSIDWKANERAGLQIWDQVTFWMDNLNYRWNYFLLDFDRTAQISLLSELARSPYLVIFLGLLSIFIMLLLWKNIYRKKVNKSPDQILLESITQWGARLNLAKDPAEAPLSYFSRLSQSFPDLHNILERVSLYYDLKKYAGQELSEGQTLLKEWKSAAQARRTRS